MESGRLGVGAVCLAKREEAGAAVAGQPLHQAVAVEVHAGVAVIKAGEVQTVGVELLRRVLLFVLLLAESVPGHGEVEHYLAVVV